MKGWPLRFFGSGEEQVCLERLTDLRRTGRTHNPKRPDLYAALKETPLEDVRVCIIGQDPYPTQRHATGIAFSIPETEDIPPSLQTIFQEYVSDLHYPMPARGSLLNWCRQGVLLWNACPTCELGKPLSHWDWVEWKELTKQIIEALNPQCIVFVFVGSKAKEFLHYVNQDVNYVIEVAHPSPRNNINPNLRNPFLGSRLFTHINDKLRLMKKEPVDWKL